MITKFYLNNINDRFSSFLRREHIPFNVLSIMITLILCIIPMCFISNTSRGQTLLAPDSPNSESALPDSANDDEISKPIQLASNSKSILEREVEFLDLERYVTVASKTEEEVTKAPSIITVITAEEIKNIGARTISEIFRIVSGMDILKKATLGQIQIGSRGVKDAE